MRVLFWNTNKNQDINHVLFDLIVENSISIIVLAEYTASIEELLTLLFVHGILMKQYSTIGCERIIILGVEADISPGRQTENTSFQILNRNDILCCLHLPSNIYNDSSGIRKIIIKRIINDIESTEKELQSKNTIVVGDFNINPFEDGCLNASQFHSIPFYEIAKKEKRVVAGEEFNMFYNPMWNFLGDYQKPYGTYYYSGNETSNTFWKIYDQVIIRPSLRSRFVDSSLRILTETSSIDLLNRFGHPDSNISDHLPITFEIKENNNG